ELGDMGNQYAYQTRFSVSYVTGSHNFKIGENSMSGFNGIAGVSPIYPYQYILNNRTPFQIKEGAYPYTQSQRLKLLLGVYASDQWTLKNLPLNLRVHNDGLNGYVPPPHYPGSATSHRPGGDHDCIGGPDDFPNVDNVPG